MTDRPLTIHQHEARAFREGRKTQFRRVLKPQPGDMDRPIMLGDGSWHVTDIQGGHMSALDVPYRVGDRLWCRETWSHGDAQKYLTAYRADGRCGAWASDGDGKPMFISHGYVLDPARGDHLGNFGHARYGGRWRPSTTMPRWASRTTLTVIGVRVQRLQEISCADAIAEGIRPVANCQSIDCDTPDPRVEFRERWDRLHGAGAWDTNPWVVASTVTVGMHNIDGGGNG